MPDRPEPALPPRPLPTRSPGEAVAAWLAWIGLTRLVLAALSVAVVVAGAYWLVRAPAPDTVALLPATDHTAAPTATLPPPTSAPAPPTAPPGPIVVHVAGEVQRPGVFTLPAGARVHTAVEAAGGATPDGALDGLNLAAPVADGQRIYVPVVGEVDPASVTAPPTGGSTAPSGTPAPTDPLDLNSANATELEQLPGIGPATAAAIVDDRTRNGPFASVDDLDRVPGIGPAKLEALRELVTV